MKTDKVIGEVLLSYEEEPPEKSYSIRIPVPLKAGIEGLNETQKKELKEAIKITIARILHESRFDPNDYITGKK